MAGHGRGQPKEKGLAQNFFLRFCGLFLTSIDEKRGHVSPEGAEPQNHNREKRKKLLKSLALVSQLLPYCRLKDDFIGHPPDTSPDVL
ncbi:hypothetical protein ACFO1S_22295 [Cohnella boryungensis]|uniref:Uncharacterized protein n=1 Tax=Cohnella boryungensis TaxID=768479 RepID=A0ABV8SF08_9BACL